MKQILIFALCFLQNFSHSQIDSNSNHYFSLSTENKIEYFNSKEFDILFNSNPNASLPLVEDGIKNFQKSNKDIYINLLFIKSTIISNVGQRKEGKDLAFKALKEAENINDKINLARAYHHIGSYYGQSRNFDSGEQYLFKAYSTIKKNLNNGDIAKNKKLYLTIVSNLGLLNLLQRKYEKSIFYNKEALYLAKELDNKKILCQTYGYIAGVYHKMENYTIAIEYAKKEIELARQINRPISIAFALLHLQEVYSSQEKWNLTRPLINESITIFKANNHKMGIRDATCRLFADYRLSGNLFEALKMENEVIELCKSTNGELSHIYVELAEIYTKLKKFDIAKDYFKRAKVYNDSTGSSEILYYKKLKEYAKAIKDTSLQIVSIQGEFDEYKKDLDTTFIKKMSEFESKYKLLEKESQIKSQQLTIQKEKNNRNLALSGIGILLLTGAGLWYIIRNRQTKKDLIAQNELLQLKQNFHTMEIQNLNQQLSPHEVKNMLASISPEIQEKAPESYKKLIKLLNLTMASLNSEDVLDSLANQVSQIEDLLFLEKNMLGDKLTYSVSNELKENVLIPRLLLKNLVENAIKHGIKTKEDGGMVKVHIQNQNDYIHISVEDNGTGRIVKQTKDTGIGTSTYRKLFAILNQKNQSQASFEIIDLPQGTKNEVKIPINYTY